MDCTEAYAQFSENGVKVLPAGTVFAYNWREARIPRLSEALDLTIWCANAGCS